MKEMTSKISREIASFCLQGNQEVNNGNQEKAILLFEKAYRKSRELDDEYRERVCAFNLGAAYLANGKPDEGLQYLHRARPQGNKKDGRSNGDLFYNIAYAYGLLKDFRNALEYYEMASAEYRSERDNLEMERECIRRSIMIYEKQYKDHTKTAEMYSKLADLQDEDGILQALSQCERANHLRLAGKDDEAEDIANKCVEKLESIMSLDSYKYSKDIGRLYNDLGLLFTQLTKYDRCLQCFELALPCVRTVQDRQLEAVILQNLGAAYNFVGDYQRAVKYLEDAASLFAELKNRNSQGQCFANLGFAFSQLPQRTEDAEEAFLHAKQAAVDTRDNHSLWQVMEGLGSVKCNQGKLDRAAEYFQEALSYVGKNRDAAQRIREKLKHVIQLEVQFEAAAQRGMVLPVTPGPQPSHRYSRIEEDPAETIKEEMIVEDAAQMTGQPPGQVVEGEVRQRFLKMRKKDSIGPHHPKMARGLAGSFMSSDSPRFKDYAIYNGKDSSGSSSDSSSSGSSSSDTDSSEEEKDVPALQQETPAVKEIFRRTESAQRPKSRQVTLKREDKQFKEYEQMLLEQDEEEQKKDGEGKSSSSSDSDSDSDEEENENKQATKKEEAQSSESDSESEDSDDSSSDSQAENATDQPPAMAMYSSVDQTMKSQHDESTNRGNDQFQDVDSKSKMAPRLERAMSGNFFTEATVHVSGDPVHKAPSLNRSDGEGEETGHYDKLDYNRTEGADNFSGGQNLSRGQRERMLFDEHQRIRGRELEDPPPLPERQQQKKSRACVVM